MHPIICEPACRRKIKTKERTDVWTKHSALLLDLLSKFISLAAEVQYISGPPRGSTHFVI